MEAEAETGPAGALGTALLADGRGGGSGGGNGFAEEEGLAGRQIALIDLLDRLLTGGVVLTGDLVLSIAEIDLVRINLRAVIHAITPDDPAPW